MKLWKNIYDFYRYDCCWPYAVSFPLVAVIYLLDFASGEGGAHWASLSAYTIIFAYYLYNVRLFKQNRLKSHDHIFFVGFLSVKIMFLGIALTVLHCLAAAR